MISLTTNFLLYSEKSMCGKGGASPAGFEDSVIGCGFEDSWTFGAEALFFTSSTVGLQMIKIYQYYSVFNVGMSKKMQRCQTKKLQILRKTWIVNNLMLITIVASATTFSVLKVKKKENVKHFLFRLFLKG